MSTQTAGLSGRDDSRRDEDLVPSAVASRGWRWDTEVRLDAETIETLDYISDRLGLHSRSRALDLAITRFWQRCAANGLPSSAATDGYREQEIIRHAEDLAFHFAVSVADVVQLAGAEFAHLLSTTLVEEGLGKCGTNVRRPLSAA